MAFRLLIYMTELWKQVFLNADKNKRERKGFKLPAIIPLVIYNSPAKWTAARSFKDMQDGSEFLGEHLLDFKYKLVDVHQCKEERLLEMRNLIGAVFCMEQCKTHDELLQRFEKVLNTAISFPDDRWIELTKWVIHILSSKFPDDVKDELIETISSVGRKEANSMVSNVSIVIENELKRSKEEGAYSNSLKIAETAILKGLSLEMVSEITGLDIEKVKEIAQKLKI